MYILLRGEQIELTNCSLKKKQEVKISSRLRGSLYIQENMLKFLTDYMKGPANLCPEAEGTSLRVFTAFQLWLPADMNVHFCCG